MGCAVERLFNMVQLKAMGKNSTEERLMIQWQNSRNWYLKEQLGTTIVGIGMRKDCWETVKPNWSQVAGSAQGPVYTAVHTGLALRSSNGWSGKWTLWEWKMQPTSYGLSLAFIWGLWKLQSWVGIAVTSESLWQAEEAPLRRLG